MTKILIDANSCPVVDGMVRLCGRFGVECLILYDTSHHLEKVGARMPVVSKGADSVDFALINLLWPGDTVVTQDYGLVATCMTYDARILNQGSMEYTAQSIDALLLTRYTVKEVRNTGSRLKGPCKRLPEQDRAFCGKLACLLGEE